LKKKKLIDQLQIENMKFAKKLSVVKSSVPGQEQLKKEFQVHKKTKELRTRLPLVKLHRKHHFASVQVPKHTDLDDRFNRNSSDLTNLYLNGVIGDSSIEQSVQDA